MTEVTQEHANALGATYSYFFDEHIVQTTYKGVQVATFNYKGNWFKAWIPKSKIKYVDVTDKREKINNGHKMLPNPNYDKLRRKYYVPKYFTDPSRISQK